MHTQTVNVPVCGINPEYNNTVVAVGQLIVRFLECTTKCVTV